MRLLLSLVLDAGYACSQRPRKRRAARKEPSAYDKIWGRFTEWYADDTNPVVQRVLFSGRFQYDFATIDADQGDHDEWNVRRMRHRPANHAVPQVHPPRRGRARPAGTGSALRAVHRLLPAVEQERAIRADGRQAERAVYDGRGDIVQGAPDDRPEQPGQQHLVSAGVHARRERVGQACAVGLSRRRVFVRRNEPRIRRVQRRHSSRSASSATILRQRSA